MKKTRTGALILAAVMTAGALATTAFAAQPPTLPTLPMSQGEISPYFIHASTATVAISASSMNLTGRVNITARENTADIDGTLYLEQKSGGSWVDVDSWGISGTGSILASETYYGAEKGTYRFRAVVTVNGEIISVVSPSKTI